MGVNADANFGAPDAARHVPNYVDLAKPVVVSAVFGTLAGHIYGVAHFDVVPHAILVLITTLTSLVAISRQSKRVARSARALIAATATWMLADSVAYFGMPPYVALPVALLFYRYIAVAAAFIGGVFGQVMRDAFVLAAFAVSLTDVIVVYKARLYFASMLRRGVDELVADFGSYFLGFADLLWYSAAFAAAKPIEIPLVAVAIYAGLVTTAHLAKRAGYAPALPLPLLLSAMLILSPLP